MAIVEFDANVIFELQEHLQDSEFEDREPIESAHEKINGLGTNGRVQVCLTRREMKAVVAFVSRRAPEIQGQWDLLCNRDQSEKFGQDYEDQEMYGDLCDSLFSEGVYEGGIRIT